MWDNISSHITFQPYRSIYFRKFVSVVWPVSRIMAIVGNFLLYMLVAEDRLPVCIPMSWYFIKDNVETTPPLFSTIRISSTILFWGTAYSSPQIFNNEKATTCALSKELKWWLHLYDYLADACCLHLTVTSLWVEALQPRFSLPLDYHSSKRISQLTIIQDPLGDVHRGRSYQVQR